LKTAGCLSKLIYRPVRCVAALIAGRRPRPNQSERVKFDTCIGPDYAMALPADKALEDFVLLPSRWSSKLIGSAKTTPENIGI
jgi:hypothetical protein